MILVGDMLVPSPCKLPIQDTAKQWCTPPVRGSIGWAWTQYILGLKIQWVTHPCWVQHVCPDGQMLDTPGTITGKLCLGSKSWQHVFYVLRESTWAALLCPCLPEGGVTVACGLSPTDQDITLREGMHLVDLIFFLAGRVWACATPTGFQLRKTLPFHPIICLWCRWRSLQLVSSRRSAWLCRWQNTKTFSTSEGVIGKCTLIKRHIKTGDYPPL